MAICAACKAKVDDGAVRCNGCDASLASTASFVRVVGFVTLAVSSVPLGLGIVAEGNHSHLPLIIGGCIFVVGLVLTFIGNAPESPPVLPDEDEDEFARA